jgi:hypothetical protein
MLAISTFRLLLLALWWGLARAAVFNWIDDNINVTTSLSTNYALQQTLFNVRVTANGVIFTEQTGHYHVAINYTSAQGFGYFARSECVDLSSPGEQINSVLKRTQLYKLTKDRGTAVVDTEPAFPLSKLYITSVKRHFHNYTSSHKRFDTTFEVLFGRRKNITETLHVALDSTGCSKPRTIGYWDDTTRWAGGAVPGSTDTVNIHPGAGVVRVSRNVTVAALNMAGGHILNYDTYCAYGWSAEPEGRTG